MPSGCSRPGSGRRPLGWKGAAVALELACRHPELVTGLVLLEPPFRAKQPPRPAILRAVLGATLLGRLGRAEAGAERFLRWALARHAIAFDAASVVANVVQRHTSAALPGSAFQRTYRRVAFRPLAILVVPGIT